MSRSATIERSTKETSIKLSLDLDGTGKSELSTGIPFLDHMVEQISRHGLVDLTIDAKGDKLTADGSILKQTAGELHMHGNSVSLKSVTTSGNMYITAENDIQLDGYLDATVSAKIPVPDGLVDFIYPADIGGVSVISENGKIATGGGDSLNVAIYGYSDDVVDGWEYGVGSDWPGPVENPGVDLPYMDDAGNPQGKAAIVLKSHDTLNINPSIPS